VDCSFFAKGYHVSLLRLEDSSEIEGERAQAARAETNDLQPMRNRDIAGEKKKKQRPQARALSP
jgi:hypothetical protein